MGASESGHWVYYNVDNTTNRVMGINLDAIEEDLHDEPINHAPGFSIYYSNGTVTDKANSQCTYWKLYSGNSTTDLSADSSTFALLWHKNTTDTYKYKYSII